MEWEGLHPLSSVLYTKPEDCEHHLLERKVLIMKSKATVTLAFEEFHESMRHMMPTTGGAFGILEEAS